MVDLFFESAWNKTLIKVVRQLQMNPQGMIHPDFLSFDKNNKSAQILPAFSTLIEVV